jgi:hypothetical protein
VAELSLVRRMRAIAILLASVGIAVGAEHAPYRWSHDLPKPLATGKPASHRTPAEVDALFADHTRHASLDEILSALGEPDAFTPQSLYSATRGSAQPQPQGGTVRFVLHGGGQLLIRTGDFHVIYEAIRYDQKGRGTLLAK